MAETKQRKHKRSVMTDPADGGDALKSPKLPPNVPNGPASLPDSTFSLSEAEDCVVASESSPSGSSAMLLRNRAVRSVAVREQ